MASKRSFATSERFVTPRGRLSYPALLEPTQYTPKDEPKYKLSLILSKDDPDVEAAIEKLHAMQDSAIKEAFGKDLPRDFSRYGIIDGDSDEVEDPYYRNSWVIRAANKVKPKLVDADKNDLLDTSEVYGGAYARANIVAFAYGDRASGGVTLQLLAVQLTGGGDAFGGAQAAINAAADDF